MSGAAGGTKICDNPSTELDESGGVADGSCGVLYEGPCSGLYQRVVRLLFA